ncbi:heat shock factor protein 5-like isoform X2 [Tachysurus fulvidraco]|uniref:heat shock factor protein 5-like isoform X2 n=1 Tax=Tachysurus fulvidraco TaxID=1234273 RepID=UPI001FEF5C6C|nr:heat shock factor protein 5-like isoform X2 [Tachysurus fulvidraco]
MFVEYLNARGPQVLKCFQTLPIKSGNEESQEGADIISARMDVNRRNFPSKLWHLVNDPQICSICWDDSGEGILICQEAFKAEVLSTANKRMNKYFETKDFISFIRQLNLYGFRKVRPDYEISEWQVSTMHHFSNPNFKRANPELLVNLKRLTASNKAKLAAKPEVSDQSGRSHYPIQNSPENSAVVAGMKVNEILLSVRINRRNFPSKLWHLVNDPQICSICWDDRGEGILICQEAFKAEVLSTSKKRMNKYFETKDFISFVRQLNLYGFRKVRPDSEISERRDSSMHHFSNPNFKRANPELLVKVKRLTPSNKAKLAAGLEVSNQSRRSHYPMWNSPENSAVVGTDLVNHQGASYHLYSQQGKGSDTTPQTSQAFVTAYGDSRPQFCHFQMDFLWAHPSSRMQQGLRCAVPDGNLGAFIPHFSQCRLYAPEYQCYMPGSLDSKMRCSKQEVASYTHRGFDPDYSFSHLQYTVQNPNWQSADAPDPRKSYMNLDNDKVEVEVQDSSVSPVRCTAQDPNWQSADDPYPRTSYMNLDTFFHSGK